jgi:hypothetical protein
MPDDHNMLPADTPTASESFRSAPHDFSESVGTVPNVSERNTPSFPNASEAFGNTPPSASETMDDVLYRPPRQAVHTLTVREVEKLFEQAGSPVTERSILNWCKPNREGVCRLDCGYERGEYRWYISPASVERVIDDERKKNQPLPKDSLEFTEARERLSESFGKEQSPVSENDGTLRKAESQSFGKRPDVSERYASPSEPVERSAAPRGGESQQAEATRIQERESLQKRIQELEREVAAGQYKDELITSMRDRLSQDRHDYNERMQFFQKQVEKLQETTTRYVDELVGINRRVGQLEAENRSLRQLPAGDRSTPRNAEDSSGVREEYRRPFEPTPGPDMTDDQPGNHAAYHA